MAGTEAGRYTDGGRTYVASLSVSAFSEPRLPARGRGGAWPVRSL